MTHQIVKKVEYSQGKTKVTLVDENGNEKVVEPSLDGLHKMTPMKRLWDEIGTAFARFVGSIISPFLFGVGGMVMIATAGSHAAMRWRRSFAG